MRYLTGTVACLVMSGMAVVGCSKDEPMADKPAAAMKSPTAKPTTRPMAARPAGTATTRPAAAAAAAPAAAPMMAETDMTHELTADAPVYGSMPTTGMKPASMLKAGTKVLVMVPRGRYTHVTTVGGVKGYVTTASLKPIGS